VSVVVPSVNLLIRGSLDEHSSAICLDLLMGDELHSDLLRLGWLVLDVDVLLHGELLLDGLGWQQGQRFQRCAFRSRLLRLVPLHVVLLGHDVRVLGGGEGVGELLVVVCEGVVGEGVGGGELLVVLGGEGGEGGGGKLLSNSVLDSSFLLTFHFSECIPK
jgi:hypothetical protein